MSIIRLELWNSCDEVVLVTCVEESSRWNGRWRKKYLQKKSTNFFLVPCQRYQDSRHLFQNQIVHQSVMGFSNHAQRFSTPYYLDVDSPFQQTYCTNSHKILVVALTLPYPKNKTVKMHHWSRVSKSHGLTVVWPRKNFLTLRKILRFACTNYKSMHFNLFYSFFFFMFHAYYMIFSDIFALFLAQNFKTKVLTAQKNLLLECLHWSKKKYLKLLSQSFKFG